MPLLEVDDLHVAYGELEVVKGISLAIGPGEIVTVLGSTAFLLSLMVMRAEERREIVGIVRLIGVSQRFVLLVVLALWRLMKGVFEGSGYMPPDAKASRPVKLVRDPICGVYVSTTGQTLVAHAHGQTAYFCSERCREQWERG